MLSLSCSVFVCQPQHQPETKRMNRLCLWKISSSAIRREQGGSRGIYASRPRLLANLISNLRLNNFKNSSGGVHFSGGKSEKQFWNWTNLPLSPLLPGITLNNETGLRSALEKWSRNEWRGIGGKIDSIWRLRRNHWYFALFQNFQSGSQLVKFELDPKFCSKSKLLDFSLPISKDVCNCADCAPNQNRIIL